MAETTAIKSAPAFTNGAQFWAVMPPIATLCKIVTSWHHFKMSSLALVFGVFVSVG